ncbi:Gfo/Idh/MocA family oxidoreductase [Streptomyces sp. DSM 44915]|uniref:Gfo/Idh/MocA family oxidoreductase n=1 Tax=Streptomyces chisholmiae TaxID=3075540 RepID=A0ABU2JXU2_9ACTN|nr:Gfo/Idh/MocA family oxidoreductase [Streptomyces sp. DSM 44915]MDT0269018.1 Gfo/Idh/MocA family oxidoreductase [Streptomyces sp. DSM 44915]
MTGRIGPGRPLRTVVAGTNFGRFYVDAVRAHPGFELAGIVSRGGAQSRALADRLAVPCYASVDELPDTVDAACVVVPAAVMGGSGTELGQELLRRGVHVLQEHPLHPDELAASLRLARSVGRQFRVNTHYPHVASVRRFLAAAAALRARQPVLFVDAAAPVHVLAPLVDILGRALAGLRPWRLGDPAAVPDGVRAAADGAAPLRLLPGTVAGVPLTLRVQNQLHPGDRDNHALFWHRVSVGTEGGVLTLADTHGPVLWHPRLHSPRDAGHRLVFEPGPGAEGLLLPASETLDGDGPPPSFAEVFADWWPAAVGVALTEFADAIGTGADPLRAAGHDLAVFAFWRDLMARLGPPELIRPGPPTPLAASDLWPGPGAAAADAAGAGPVGGAVGDAAGGAADPAAERREAGTRTGAGARGSTLDGAGDGAEVPGGAVDMAARRAGAPGSDLDGSVHGAVADDVEEGTLGGAGGGAEVPGGAADMAVRRAGAPGSALDECVNGAVKGAGAGGQVPARGTGVAAHRAGTGARTGAGARGSVLDGAGDGVAACGTEDGVREAVGDAPGAGYEGPAEFFDLGAREHTDRTGPAVVAALAGLDPASGPLLDIGAGTGLVTRHIAEAFPACEIVAAEPAAGMRAILTARLAERPDLARRVTVLPAAAHEVALPERLSGAVLCGVLGHLAPAARRALLTGLAARLAPGAPLVVEVMGLTTPVSMPPTRLRRATLGRLRYEWWMSGEPSGPERMRLATSWRVFDRDRLVREVRDHYHWHTVSLPQLARESGLTLHPPPAPHPTLVPHLGVLRGAERAGVTR